MDLHDCFIQWGQNAGVLDNYGLSWRWSSQYDPRHPPENEQDQQTEWWDTGEPAYGPDYNFNDGDW